MGKIISFTKDKDWPKCKYCGSDLNSFLEIFGIRIFEKCPNKNRSVIDVLKHIDHCEPYRCDGPWS